MRLGLTVFVLGLRGLEALDPFGRNDRGDARINKKTVRRSTR
jgi:hypothetical protein